MKKIGFVNVMMMVFAILAIFLGAYVFHRATYAFSKTNGGNGIVMAMNDFNYEMNEYKQLADDLEE
ncbi:MAG: hypothetical protein ILP02_04710 [Clostridia bacterium]|nr:hypothetical protein [Clostridia bacterium]